MTYYADAYLEWVWVCPACGQRNTMEIAQDWEECSFCGATVELDCAGG